MCPLTEKLARLFYTYHGMLAPEYDPAKKPSVSWEQLPDSSKHLLRSTVDAVLDHLVREANFAEGVEVRVRLPIEGADGSGPFAFLGERGKLRMTNQGMSVVFEGGDRQWWGTGLRELALHLEVV